MFPTEPTDSIKSIDISDIGASLKSMSLDEVAGLLIQKCVHLVLAVVTAVLVFYAGRYIIRKIYGLVEKIMIKRQVEPSLCTFILSLVNIVLYFILIVTVVGILGLETSSFLAIFASAGVALGMALSGTLQNFAGGVLILLLKPFKVGDYIEAQGFAGTVKRIEIFNTIITTPDNKTILIPNGALSTSSINNYATQEHRRVDWTVGISYGDSTARAREALLAILASDERVLRAPEGPADPVVYVSELADSSVNLSVRAWVRSGDYWDVYFRINERIYCELPEAAGISFPFPQMDVHVDRGGDVI